MIKTFYEKISMQDNLTRIYLAINWTHSSLEEMPMPSLFFIDSQIHFSLGPRVQRNQVIRIQD